MPGKPQSAGVTMADVLVCLGEVERVYSCKVRLSIVPRPTSGYTNGCIVLATPYHRNGKKMANIEAEQHLWPTSAFKHIEGLFLYLLHGLENALAEAETRAALAREETPEGSFTPLEEYIARYDMSYPQG